MKPETCPSSETLESFCSGTLNSGSDELAAHLDECSDCEARVKALSEHEAENRKPGNGHAFSFQRETAYRRAEAALRQVPSDGSLPEAVAHVKSTHFSGYQLHEEIGRGGMGIVYRARHVKLDRDVALKVLSRDRLNDEDAKARFEREITAAGKLSHPHVVTTHDAGEIDGEPYLVMELLDGVDLARVADAAAPLDVPDACELIRQACLGLHHAHDHGIVHRDVKLSNLILCRDRGGDAIVKVLDLGLARFSRREQPLNELTGAGQFMGTLEFMAPEQAAGSSEVDERVDVYSLGVCLFRLLCGQSPYDQNRLDTPLKMLQAIGNEAPDSIGTHRDLPEPLARLIDSMLNRDPASRPGSLRDVAETLEEFASGKGLNRLLHSKLKVRPDLDTAVPDATVSIMKPAGTSAVVRTKSKTGRSPFARGLAIGVLVIASGLLAYAGVLFFQTKHGTLLVEINDKSIEVTVDGDDRLRVKDGKAEFELTPGPHKLHVKSGEVKFSTKAFEIPRGEGVALKVTLIPGAKIEVTRDGTVLTEKVLKSKTDDAPKPAKVSEKATLRYGDRIGLSLWEKICWLKVNEPTNVLVDDRKLTDVFTIWDDQCRGTHAWTIRKSVSEKENNAIVRYGDEVLLTNGSKWLIGKTTAFPEGEDNVFCDELTKDEDAAAFRWRIQPEPTMSKSAKKWKLFGQPVRVGDVVYLGCRCLKKMDNREFDGYAILYGGRKKGDTVWTTTKLPINPHFSQWTIHSAP